MSNVLSEDKKQQVIALGKLGWSLRRIEEATGVRRETASAYLRAAGVVVYLPGWGRRVTDKTGHTADPGPGFKTGHTSDPRLLCGFFTKTTCPQHLRSIPRANRRGASPRSQRQGHLAGLGVGARLHRRLSGGEALCSEAAWTTTPGTSGDHPHGSRRRSSSRLRQRSDGARCAKRQVSSHTAVRPNARLQPKVRSLADLA